MTVFDLVATLTAGGLVYFLISVVMCALHVRFNPHTKFSLVFRKRPILAIFYPVLVSYICFMTSIKFGRRAFIRVFEFISGRKTFQKRSNYAYSSRSRGGFDDHAKP